MWRTPAAIAIRSSATHLLLPCSAHARGRHAGGERDVQLAAGGDVEQQPLVVRQPGHRPAQERLRRVDRRAGDRTRRPPRGSGRAGAPRRRRTAACRTRAARSATAAAADRQRSRRRPTAAVSDSSRRGIALNAPTAPRAMSEGTVCGGLAHRRAPRRPSDERRHRMRGFGSSLTHICSGTSMPSRPRLCSSTRAVRSAQREAARADRLVGLEHRAVLVERREVRRQVVQVGAQLVRADTSRASRRALSGTPAGAGRAPAPAACRARSAPTRTRRPIDLGPPEDRADPGVGVLQVGRRVAVERQHPVPVEDVVLDAVGRQVGVLHRADADRARQRRPASSSARSGFFSAIAAAARSTASSSSSISFTESPVRLRSILRSSPSTLPNDTCTASRRRHQPAGHARDLEHHLQVLRLRCPDDVDQQIGVEPLDAIEHAGQVARGVHERPRTGAHDQRQGLVLAVGEPGREHDLGAVALRQRAPPPRAARTPPASAPGTCSRRRGRRRSAARRAGGTRG